MDLRDIYSIIGSSLQQGLLLSLVTLGLMLSFRFLNFPDLTVEGSFTLGGAVAATLIIKGYDPKVALFCAIISGVVAGLATALLNIKFRINKLLSGILIATILYSVNLRVMNGSNISLLNSRTILSFIDDINFNSDLLTIFLLLFIVLLVVISVSYFLKTEIGVFFRACGDNPHMVRSLGFNTNLLVFLGLGLSNALVAFSGGLVCQHQGFADVNMGFGTLITGLTSLLIGESLINVNSISKLILASLLGSFTYFLIISFALRLGLAATDLKMITGIIGIIILSLKMRENKQFLRSDW